MNEYQASALGQGIGAVVILLVASIVYFIASKNKNIVQRILVSTYPLVFVVGEFYALLASSYYTKGSWKIEFYARDVMSTVLGNILNGIFLLGIVMAIYTWKKYQGNRIAIFAIVPILFVAAYLFFISGMTLSRDWL